MKVVYELPIAESQALRLQNHEVEATLNDVKVCFVLENEPKALLAFSGISIKQAQDGVVVADMPEIEERAYQIAAYVSNFILINTGCDCLSPKTIVMRSPHLIAENDKEEAILKKCGIRRHTSVPALIEIILPLDVEKLPASFGESKAIALYADALRVNSPFQQYELFYKVFEYYVELSRGSVKGNKFDQVASERLRAFDRKYSTYHSITPLRKLRHRCVHAANRAHASPKELASLREVQAHLVEIREIAKWLIDNPDA